MDIPFEQLVGDSNLTGSRVFHDKEQNDLRERLIESVPQIQPVAMT